MTAVFPAEAPAETIGFLLAVRERVAAGTLTVHVPPVFVLEFFAVINRERWKRNYAAYPEIESDPIPVVHEEVTSEECIRFQEDHKRFLPDTEPHARGADLMYLLVARRLAAPLVTHDRGLLAYRRPFCEVREPGDWLGTYG